MPTRNSQQCPPAAITLPRIQDGLGWFKYMPAQTQLVSPPYKHLRLQGDGPWAKVYAYGLLWARELCYTTEINDRLESLAVVYAMLKACDRGLVTAGKWGPAFTCPSGYRLDKLMRRVLGAGTEERRAVAWFIQSVVETGRRILTCNPESVVNGRGAMATAVERTLWRLDEGMFRTALVLSIWLRCGRKVSVDDPAVIAAAACAAMTHDALSIFRSGEESQDKSKVAAILGLGRAEFSQALLMCVKCSEVALRKVAEEGNMVWTLLDNFSVSHIELNILIDEYGVRDQLLGSLARDSLPENGALSAVPDRIHPRVVQYFAEVLAAAAGAAGGASLEAVPWGQDAIPVAGGVEWIRTTCHIALATTFKPGRPGQLLAQFMRDNIGFTTPLGLKLLAATKGSDMAISGLHYAYMALQPHVDRRYTEAVAVLLADLFAVGKARDAGSRVAEFCGAAVPPGLINLAWEKVRTLTCCTEEGIQLMQKAYAESIIVRSTSVCRDIAMRGRDRVKAGGRGDVTLSRHYGDYMEWRIIDGFWRFYTMLCLAIENGRPQDADLPSVRNLLEASILLLEEASRARRTTDDGDAGYWSLVGGGEAEARAWGRQRGSALFREAWHALAADGVNWGALWTARGPFKHNLNALPGSGSWLAFERLKLHGN